MLQTASSPDARVDSQDVSERPRILVVDDEDNIRRIIETRLSLKGYTVISACDGDQALQRFQEQACDLVLLDVMLPRQDGFSVLESLRQTSDVPVLMLTACGDLQDRVLGLQLGADDYLLKPFSLVELEARIRCLLRRAEQGRQGGAAVTRAAESAVLEVGGLRIVLAKRQVFRGEERVKLTGMEFSMLELLIGRAGEPIARMDILRRIWGYSPDRHADTRVVDVHISRLRLKLELDPTQPELILTARGTGYMFRRLPQPGSQSVTMGATLRNSHG